MNPILGSDMATLSRMTNARSRSICAENPTGEKGKGGMATTGTGANCARELGQGWKISPSVRIEPHTVYTMADITGSGAIQHIPVAVILNCVPCMVTTMAARYINTFKTK